MAKQRLGERSTEYKVRSTAESCTTLSNEQTPSKNETHRSATRNCVPEVYSVVIECRDEAEQRELWERMRREGRRVRVMVL
jgi:hypothetical protein